jgi:tRNA/rRNA methyltransferase
MTSPAVILVRPQLGENIGSAARSMKNFGMEDLRIVSPRDGWPNPKALEMAKHASDIIEKARVVETLEEALDGIESLYATTARPRDIVKTEYTPAAAMAHIIKEEQTSAIMFGPERTGLTNQDLAYADAIITIPVNKEYPSLNLSQAVTVSGYEWFKQQQKDTPRQHLGNSSIANKKEVADFVQRLITTLDQKEFFKVEEKRDGMVVNITNMFGRHDYTDQEIRTLQGILSSLNNK